MKQLFTLSALAVTILLLAQCSPKTAKTVAADKPATTGPVIPSAADQAHGQAIFQASCGKCHKLYAPETRTVKAWNRILPEMYQKSKFDATKAALVDAYVLTNAKKG